MARIAYTQERIELRREEILDAAMVLFEEGGISAVSFRRIASKLDCSYSAPYRYFASKYELLTALRARAFRWIEQRMSDAIAGISNPIEQLRKLARTYMDAALEMPDRYALMFFEIGDDDLNPSSELTAAKRDALGLCTRVVSEAERSGGLSLRVDPESASHLFWSGAHGLVSLQVAGQFVMGRSFDELAPLMIETLITGLKADVKIGRAD
ncbi:MAG: TetR/AcrR family transcriptional regulator [Stenotrophobium sp.]